MGEPIAAVMECGHGFNGPGPCVVTRLETIDDVVRQNGMDVDPFYVQIGWLTTSNFFLELKPAEEPHAGWEAVYARRGGA